jgi:hypothetical protein
MRQCARKSPHSLAQLDFRTLRMLSQDEMLHHSPMLRSSKLSSPATSETGHPF